MNIAIQAADLDYARIDGTRVYILHMLRHFGEIDADSTFHIYHKREFNPELRPPAYDNYAVHRLLAVPFWTQTRFTAALLQDRPDALWMPMHNTPLLRRSQVRTTVTIHDLAFLLYPEYFPTLTRRKITLLTDLAIKHADHIITVSESSKRDILRFYPQVREEQVNVVYHGFDRALFEGTTDRRTESILLESLSLEPQGYLLYTGAIQPRKNLRTLIKAFEQLKRRYPWLKLVIAGAKAWMWQRPYKYITKSIYHKDIIVTGTIDFDDLATLYRSAAVFVLPSLYEGFGMPILEAFAARVPVVCADNSSLPEVAGDAALYFDAEDATALASQVGTILDRSTLREELIAKGSQQMQQFSWEQCARQTLGVIKG